MGKIDDEKAAAKEAAVAELANEGKTLGEVLSVGEAVGVGAAPQRRKVRVRLTVKDEMAEREYECDVTDIPMPATARRVS